MNVLLILIDSLNRHYLSCYGNDWVKTPNMQRLADRGIVFDNHFIGSAPSIPARRDLFAGRQEFLWRGWGNLEPFDRHLATVAGERGVHTAIVTDHSPYWNASHGYGYMQAFEDYQMIRGNMEDHPAAPSVSADALPQWVQSMARYYPVESCIRYYRNAMTWHTAEDFPCGRLMSSAAEQLATCSGGRPVFMQIESCDPHEPWYVPEPYRSMYGPYRQDVTCWAPYFKDDVVGRFFAENDEQALQFIRRQYAANVTMVDDQLGKVLDVLDRDQRWDDTAVMLVSDHGHELGERGCFGKYYPHWDTHANVPLIVWHPDHPGPRRSGAFSTMVDLHSTILDMLGVEPTDAPHGRSLMPVIRGEQDQVRRGVLYGWFGLGCCWTDHEYTFMSGYDNLRQSPVWYSTMMAPGKLATEAASGRFIPGVDHPVWRYECSYDDKRDRPKQMAPAVYARSDHAQQHDLSDDPKLLAECRRRMIAAMNDVGAPREQYRRLLLADA